MRQSDKAAVVPADTLSDLLDNTELLIAGMGNDAVERQIAELREHLEDGEPETTH